MNDKYFNLDGEDLMTANEVVKLFNVSYSAVIGWAKLKKLKSIKINNRMRFPVSDVNRFIARYYG